MPLYILGLILLISILVLQIVKLVQSRKYDKSATRRTKSTHSDENEQAKTLYFPIRKNDSDKQERD